MSSGPDIDDLLKSMVEDHGKAWVRAAGLYAEETKLKREDVSRLDRQLSQPPQGLSIDGFARRCGLRARRMKTSLGARMWVFFDRNAGIPEIVRSWRAADSRVVWIEYPDTGDRTPTDEAPDELLTRIVNEHGGSWVPSYGYYADYPHEHESDAMIHWLGLNENERRVELHGEEQRRGRLVQRVLKWLDWDCANSWDDAAAVAKLECWTVLHSLSPSPQPMLFSQPPSPEDVVEGWGMVERYRRSRGSTRRIRSVTWRDVPLPLSELDSQNFGDSEIEMYLLGLARRDGTQPSAEQVLKMSRKEFEHALTEVFGEPRAHVREVIARYGGLEKLKHDLRTNAVPGLGALSPGAPQKPKSDD